jgi:D-alanyl-lipoteichoic acid acyltransferase DltB (MBOAT superfamily)
MLFHSQTFLLAFLPLTITLYYTLADDVRAREWLLILASLIFYGWWDIRFVPLLLAQKLGTWTLAEVHFRSRARWPLVLGILANLSVLALFKYVDFLIATAESILGLSLPRAGLILPIGISFFTFQSVSYLVDAQRGTAPRYPMRRFLLFVVLFPQLIAGPIVRHNEILTQFDRDPLRPGVAERVSRGVVLLLAGVVAKVFIADTLAATADPMFKKAAGAVPTLSDAALGTLAFAFQIFFDFAAYSDMAIGLGLMLGLALPINFDQPYRATSLRDFWRRWHMTLSRWLRDYLYIPLGGSREGHARYVMAALVTMALCGLWHGAGWTFVLWGLAHGAGLVVCYYWSRWGPPMPAPIGWLLTFLFAVVLFGLFRSPDVATAVRLGEGLLGLGGLGTPWPAKTMFLLAAAGALALMPVTVSELVHRSFAPSRPLAIAAALASVCVVLEVGQGQPLSFIYFQF